MKATLVLLLSCLSVYAETGYDAWLRYQPVTEPSARQRYLRLPATIVSLDDTPVIRSARDELVRGVRGMLGRTLRTSQVLVNEDMLLLGGVSSLAQSFPDLVIPAALIDDGYCIQSLTRNGHRILLIVARNDRGVLYGSFALLRHMALGDSIEPIHDVGNPYQPIRWVNEWDNLDGSIERGYAGRSIFFADGNVVPDLSRAADYARLLASLGINGCTVNNVNANPRILTPEFLPQLARIAEAFRAWGVRLSISVPFSAPKTVGGLDSFDPEDTQVQAWWKAKFDAVYAAVPDLAGVLVKADSEGQLGPSTYGRTQAQAANLLADAVRPHGGVVIYRGFVYNHHMDWRDLKNDRAKAAFDNFRPLDGQFAENALLQIKYGPIDFQPREPVSPLIGALPHTNETLELQITQEYTGQQRHLCYLAPMWKEVLDFDLHTDGHNTPVRAIVSGKTFQRHWGGMVGVSNVGLDLNWFGSDLAASNLYAFGRLAWNPELSVDQITNEWTVMTWGNDAQVRQTVMDLELNSWRTYESYTGPLGLGALTDILHGHYGPGIETAERNGWGQWIRADHEGIGMDRTVATGTGFIGQYARAVAGIYETLPHCPDELLLFMHHVPYTYRLHSGKTMIQEIYDAHYRGAQEVEEFVRWWEALRGRVDEGRYQAVLNKLQYQAGHAVVWRDAICNWFQRESGIPDARGRVGHHPNRVEAEAMQLMGYQIIEVNPWEDASGGKAVSCPVTNCSAEFRFDERPGWYNLRVQYFDTSPGEAHFNVFVNAQETGHWSGHLNLPWQQPNGDTSTGVSFNGVALRTGDVIKIVGVPEASDMAALDYVELIPDETSPFAPSSR